jgi:hypothetical protein
MRLSQPHAPALLRFCIFRPVHAPVYADMQMSWAISPHACTPTWGAGRARPHVLPAVVLDELRELAPLRLRGGCLLVALLLELRGGRQRLREQACPHPKPGQSRAPLCEQLSPW